jgi:hypothetical protein
MKTPLTVLVSSLIFTVPALAQQAAAPKHAILIAGKPSHGPGQHEHNAGVLLLKKCLDESGLPIKTTVKLNADWPSKAELASADTVLIYCDGGKHHLLLQEDRLQQLATEIKRGCGLLCLHYAVEYPKDNGGPEMLDWMGGFFEQHWSVNPHWDAEFKGFPEHPISSGLQPYTIRDEWYFHMRFADPAKGQLTHILSAVAPDSTMSRKDGPHRGIQRSARRSPTRSRKPPHGLSSARTGAAVSASPAAISTATGATTTNASWSSTPSSGPPKPKSRPRVSPAR